MALPPGELSAQPTERASHCLHQKHCAAINCHSALSVWLRKPPLPKGEAFQTFNMPEDTEQIYILPPLYRCGGQYELTKREKMEVTWSQKACNDNADNTEGTRDAGHTHRKHDPLHLQ